MHAWWLPRASQEAEIKTNQPTILFLCVHNAGRSQMAAGWARDLAGGRARVISGGSSPGDEIHPNVVTAMSEVGIDVSRELPKPSTDEGVQAADVVITMGCGDACPIYQGKRYEDWDVADPAGAELDAVRATRDDIRARVEELLRSLGVETAP